MYLYHYLDKKTLYIFRENNSNMLANQASVGSNYLSKEDLLLYEKTMLHILKRYGMSVERVVIDGDWTVIPAMKSFLIRPHDTKGMLVNSDFQYSVRGQQIIPVVRNVLQDKVYSISGNHRVLFLLDRPLRFHPDALYVYYLLKNNYNICFWCSNKDDSLLDYDYEMVFHFGHANDFCYKVNDNLIGKLPKARLLFSFGCHGAEAFLKLKPQISAFCGYSYFCYGQKPGFGSNELLNYTLWLMTKGECLTDAVSKAKQWYINKYKIKMGFSIPKSDDQFEASINLLSLCTVNECRLSRQQINGDCKIQYIPTERDKTIKLPLFEETLLVIIYAENYNMLSFKILDSNGKEIKWKDIESKVYGNSYALDSECIVSKSNNGMWMVLNKCYLSKGDIPTSFEVALYHIA